MTALGSVVCDGAVLELGPGPLVGLRLFRLFIQNLRVHVHAQADALRQRDVALLVHGPVDHRDATGVEAHVGRVKLMDEEERRGRRGVDAGGNAEVARGAMRRERHGVSLGQRGDFPHLRNAARVAAVRLEHVNAPFLQIGDHPPDGAVALAGRERAVDGLLKALENLDKKDLTELKAFTNPPDAVKNMCMQLINLKPTGEKLEENWLDAKKMLGNANLLSLLKGYDKDSINEKQVKGVRKWFGSDTPEQSLESMKGISNAGYGLLVWVVAILKYYEVAKNVAPLRQKVIK